MRSIGKLCIIALAFIIFIPYSAQADVIDQVGPYTISAGSPPPGGIVDDSGADATVTFWQLPLWIQVSYVTGLLAGILASIFVVVKVVPFFVIKARKALVNRNRETIYSHIEENPGCTVNDISRGQSLNAGSVRYHVYRLELERKIQLIKVGKFSRFFRNNGAYSKREIDVISALNIRTNRAIVLLLLETPGLSNKQIAEKLDIKESLAHVYLSGLLRDRIVRLEKNDRQKEYFLESDMDHILKKQSGRSRQQIRGYDGSDDESSTPHAPVVLREKFRWLAYI